MGVLKVSSQLSVLSFRSSVSEILLNAEFFVPSPTALWRIREEFLANR
jgi:hypothetical protein